VSQQESLKQTFTKQVEVKTTEIKLDSPDEKFVQDALAITEKNISNANFSVEELSRALLMSRVAAYKRLFALTGKTPIEFHSVSAFTACCTTARKIANDMCRSCVRNRLQQSQIFFQILQNAVWRVAFCIPVLQKNIFRKTAGKRI
jgi:hypothetical protein